MLKEHIADWAEAQDTLAYHCAVLRTATQLCDAHALIDSPVLEEFIGSEMAPFTVSSIEGEYVVDRSLDPNIPCGDIVVVIDDNLHRRWLTASPRMPTTRILCLSA